VLSLAASFLPALNGGQFCQNGGEGVINVIAGEQFFTQREASAAGTDQQPDFRIIIAALSQHNITQTE
jgi:hypothetical protein